MFENHYNFYEKTYPNGKRQIFLYSKAILNSFKSKNIGKSRILLEDSLKNGDIGIDEYLFKNMKSKTNSVRRTLKMIYDYSRSNNWDYFVTLTFNPDKVDSLNYEECSEKVRNWLKVSRRKNPDLGYLGVPELHKSGRYHFHFLMRSCDNFKFVDSGKKTKKGLTIYNLDNYNWGFSTATRIFDSDKVSNYIGKYITKDLASTTKGKKRYWASNNLLIPSVHKAFYDDIDSIVDGLKIDSKLKFTKVIENKFNIDEEEQTSIIYIYDLDS